MASSSVDILQKFTILMIYMSSRLHTSVLVRNSVPSCRNVFLCIPYTSKFSRCTIFADCSFPGHAFQVGTRHKLTSHLSACRSVGVEFIPLVIEALGGLTEDTISTIRTLGQAIGQRAAAPDPSISIKQLFHRVAIALWRGNARLWLHHHPTLPPSLDGVI